MMYLKLLGLLCILGCFVGVRSQRTWGAGGYNTGPSGSWSSNGFSNQNTGIWGSNKPNQALFGGNQYNTPFGGSNNRRPVEQQSFANNGGWNSNKPTGGVSNFKPDEKKTESIMNLPNTNTFSTSDNSPWGSSNQNSKNEWSSGNINSNGETSLQGSMFGSSRPSTNQNSKNEWSSGNINNNAEGSGTNDNTFSTFGSSKPSNNQNSKNEWSLSNINNNAGGSFSSGTNDNTFSTFGSSRPSNNQNSKPNNNQNNRPNNWGSNKPSGQTSNLFNNNKPSGNEVSVDSDYEDNSVYSWNSNNKEKNKPGRKTTTAKPVKSTKKPQTISDNWNQNGKTPEEANNQSDKKTVDTSILDELDKNDWYFGKESNYPKPPFKTTLNIDVSELWNFDRNRKGNENSNSGKNRGSNNRRNRQTEDGTRKVQCECVNVNLCDEEDMIVAQEDIKYDLRPLEAFRCERLTEVCCTNPKPRFVGRANIEDEREDRLLCGQRRIEKSRLSGRISELGEFPWNLRLQNSETNCSASLIHPQLALTAAHCVTNFQIDDLTVKAGIWNSNDEPPQIRKVSKVIPHPGYNSKNPRNDIALLVMENGFKLTDNVNTICLPVTNDKWDSDQCLVAGWRLEEVNGEAVEILEKEAVDFIPQPECQNIMLVTDLWRNYILHDSFVCGREKTGSNACLGNEGGPVMCLSKKQPDTYLQIGLVSEGMNCDNFGRPGIFTNVLKFLDWINKNHFDLGLNFDLDIRSL